MRRLGGEIKLSLRFLCIIETNEVPKGIGGGVNEAIKRVETIMGIPL